jgi:4-aminobutyrate aminotransferase-like enzyme
VTSCSEHGLLINKVKPNALRFMPPLIVSRDEADEAVAILDKVLSVVES